MQRDLKVGLSLGVLVLGIVGALLFRREQHSDTPRPTLKSARKIDERIAEGSRTPYMTGEVEFEPEDANGTTASTTETPNGRPAHTIPPDWLNDEEDPFQIAKNNKGQFDFRHPAHGAGAKIDPLQPLTPATNRETAGAAQTAPQTHVIQSGDSLSMLAERYLGNQGRFQEIYEANHDVLTDVNRLPVGATIVIPKASKTAEKPAAGPTVRTALGAAEKVRSKITDVTTFEPLAPPADETAQNHQSAAGVEKPATDAAAPAKVQEAKKFVTPTRTPFASRTHSTSANPHKKALDPEGENLIEHKPAATSDAAEARHYQVRKGDSLEKIATKVYGNGKRAADIFAANRQLLSSPDAVREGQELVLPE